MELKDITDILKEQPEVAEKMAEYSDAIQEAEDDIREEVTRDDKTNGLDGQDDGNR